MRSRGRSNGTRSPAGGGDVNDNLKAPADDQDATNRTDAGVRTAHKTTTARHNRENRTRAEPSSSHATPPLAAPHTASMDPRIAAAREEEETSIARHTPSASAANAAVAFGAALPAVWAAQVVMDATRCDPSGTQPFQDLTEARQLAMALWTQPSVDAVTAATCRLGVHHPVAFVNVVYTAVACVLFWLISLVQRNTWLIDLYWTLLPPMMAAFFVLHPLASGDSTRSMLSLVLLGVWSVRLTLSYLRREEWQFGAREDWRYADLRRRFGAHWYWMSFFIVYLFQQPMLVGLSMPFYAIHFDDGTHPVGILDLVAGIAAATGLTVAYFADTQLREFMLANRKRVEAGKDKVPLLQEGIWRYSRHPNYFGEQLFHWSIAALGMLAGQPWVCAGTALNSVVLAAVTVMTEARMREQPARRQVFAQYCATTSVWVPFFKFKP